MQKQDCLWWLFTGWFLLSIVFIVVIFLQTPVSFSISWFFWHPDFAEISEHELTESPANGQIEGADHSNRLSMSLLCKGPTWTGFQRKLLNLFLHLMLMGIMKLLTNAIIIYVNGWEKRKLNSITPLFMVTRVFLCMLVLRNFQVTPLTESHPS